MELVSSELTVCANSYNSLVNVTDVAGLKSDFHCFNAVHSATLKNRKQTIPLPKHTGTAFLFFN